MTRFCLILFFTTLTIQNSFAQDRITLNGKVSNSATSKPIAGAIILIENVNNGTRTDGEGNYRLSGIKKGDKIIVSAPNFRSANYTVKSSKLIQKWDFRLVDDLLSLSEMVVTNFGGTKDEEKIESSVAITTISNKEIDERLPRSNADLLKAIPGFWVESAGGEGPAGVWVRGFPQSGGYSFLGLMEDGLPIFQAGYFGLPSPDQFYRVDETLDKVEAIRGGSAPIIMQGASGAVVNHITKTGSQIFKGIAKASYGPDQGLGRFDLNLGGPISPKTTYNVGGFYRNENGLYDYGYTANKGGQIRANIEHRLDKVRIKYYTKYLNDIVNWNLPSPYAFNENGDVGEIPGFDLKTAGIGTNVDDTEYSYVNPEGETINRDLKDGFSVNLFSAGLETDFTLGDNLTLTNKFRFDDISTSNNSDIITQIKQLKADGNYLYSDGTPVVNPATLNGNGLFTSNVILENDNEYTQIIDRLELSYTTNDNALTIGAEYFVHKVDENTASALTHKEIKNAPRRITNTNPNEPTFFPAYPGGLISAAFVDRGAIGRSSGTENTFSLYLNDKWEVNDIFRIDAGIRFDNKTVDGQNWAKQEIEIPGSPIPGYILTDEVEPFDDSRSSFAASLGVNFNINENSALFLRASSAGSSIKIGDYENDLSDIEELKNTKSNRVLQSEIGYKYRGDKTGLFASIIYATVDDAIYPVVFPTDVGGLVFQNVFQSFRSVSAEIEAQYKPTDKLAFRLISTIQSAKYLDFEFIARPEAATGVAGLNFDWSDNTADRVPSLSADFTTSYTFGDLVASAGLRYYGDRWSTPANNVELKRFAELTAGLKFNFNSKLSLTAQGSNLLNTVALIEGDVQGDQLFNLLGNVPDGTPRIGRRILPRIILFKLAYKFSK